jgi:hypothetical protein
MRGPWPDSGPGQQPTGRPAAGHPGGPGRPARRADPPDDVTGGVPVRRTGYGGVGPPDGAGAAAQSSSHRHTPLPPHGSAHHLHEGIPTVLQAQFILS